MARFLLVLFGLLLTLTIGQTWGQSTRKTGPVPVIFDTDMGPDYDDVGAIAILHALADSGQARILATIASTKYPKVTAVISVLNTYFGRPNVPIGVPTGKAVTDKDTQHWSDSLTARYPHAVRSNATVPDAVVLYRQLLAKQPDQSVTIISVGFMTNLANLIGSKPDQYSPLSGRELVARKVKQLVSMAGKFPAGKEYNVYMDIPASTAVFANWPTPVLLSGFEIGEQIHSGLPLIQNGRIRNSPVKDAFAISIPLAKEDAGGRMSWDQTAVLVAIRGYAPYYTVKSGRLTMNPNGSNGWNPAAKGHQYLVANRPVGQVEKIINELMQHQPVKRR
ncbi:nucleoside hydrolase [Spirosoma utsteinense]|uniref:Inosine-uridine nucleoside N-ribohydrolase n=1 Tax=Spirosoma utsteinense TaxID=2585773 RepID=A0ABR6W4V0_9BACT|nr:nucleoside hydrolase [Spirosoma utsteinense]MBC3784256.1 inosine-uridine nucleoside N-ribohydrolase [Spirosoma utsteinense]MBC3790947.1 inosine-uridine nucleoside N-ribohydrolase [Spirosoma utsteinense]